MTVNILTVTTTTKKRANLAAGSVSVGGGGFMSNCRETKRHKVTKRYDGTDANFFKHLF